MQVCLATLRTHNFSKEKKEKKKAVRLVEGFKKASFSDKILPVKVEILSETRRA
jgi:hypothetical protein